MWLQLWFPVNPVWQGRQVQRGRGKNRTVALAIGALMTHYAVMAAVLGFWRLASPDMKARRIAISSGLFSVLAGMAAVCGSSCSEAPPRSTASGHDRDRARSWISRLAEYARLPRAYTTQWSILQCTRSAHARRFKRLPLSNVAVFLLQYLGGPGNRGPCIRTLFALDAGAGLHQTYLMVWQVFSVYVPARGIGHILFNMLCAVDVRDHAGAGLGHAFLSNIISCAESATWFLRFIGECHHRRWIFLTLEARPEAIFRC